MNKTIEIKGDWKNASERIKKGWLLPCYKCNTLTGKIVKYNHYILAACQTCVSKKLRDDPESCRVIINNALVTDDGILNISCI